MIKDLENFLEKFLLRPEEIEEVKKRIKKLFVTEEEIIDDIYPAVFALIVSFISSPP